MANKENVQLWVDELRSGKYTQTRGGLNRLVPETMTDVRGNEHTVPWGHCCLGVACETSGVFEKKTKGKRFARFDGCSDFLPTRVREWLGFRTDNPSVKIEGKGWKSLAELNDEGVDFLEISDLIQKTYL